MIEYILNVKVLLSALIIYIIYLFGFGKQNLHKKLGSKGPRPLPFIGNVISLSRHGLHEFDKICHKKYGNIYPTYFATVGFAMITDEELLKQILIKDFKCFPDRVDLGLHTKTTEKMLTTLKGKDWERVRNIVSPTFTSGKLKKMSPLLADCVGLLSKRLKNTNEDDPIDFKEFFGALTMDSIARTMFGMEIDSQTNPNNLFIVNAKKIFNMSFRNPVMWAIILCPALGRLILKWCPDWEYVGQNIMNFFYDNIQKAINERKASEENYNDFLALMMKVDKEARAEGGDASDSLGTKYLTLQEIIAQALIFLMAGYETTSTTLTFACYFLAKNPAIQQQLYDELMDTVGVEGELSYDTLMQMPLLDAAINETLRMCPPAARFDRVCTKDVDLIASDKRIIHAKVGDVFTVPVYAIHTDPSIWPDPDSFDITRFDQENKKSRSQYAFMPFGMGPRNCVGMRFALLEIKWTLATVLRDFEIRTCAQTSEIIKFKPFGLAEPVTPIILKIYKRQ